MDNQLSWNMESEEEISPGTRYDYTPQYSNTHTHTPYSHYSTTYGNHHAPTHTYVSTPSSATYGHHSSMQASTPSDRHNSYPGSHASAHCVHNPQLPQGPTVPKCTPVQSTLQTNNKRRPPLSSEVVNFTRLLPPDVVKQKYPELRGPQRAGELAVKLAVEAYFGPDVLARCTVAGCRSLPGLPVEQLQKLKQFIFRQTPQFWDTPCDFDREVWSTCTVSINQKCKTLRKASSCKE